MFFKFVEKLKFPFFILAVFLMSCGGNAPEGHLDQLELAEKTKKFDQALGEPQPGQWLYEHKEPGQSFSSYTLVSPVSVSNERKIIYLLPIGKFSEARKKILNSTSDYLNIFFGLETRELKNISDSIIPPKCKREREDGSVQFLTGFILDSILSKRIPDDGVVVMAVTASDLYPGDNWNFVFGQAYTRKRIGVSSIYRYSEQELNDENYSVCLERLIKTSSHEIGHMFSILHCTNAVCVMNGSNSLQESDSRPNRLCSECLKKLYWNLGFDLKERLLKLIAFFEKHSLYRDKGLAEQDLEEISPSAKPPQP